MHANFYIFFTMKRKRWEMVVQKLMKVTTTFMQICGINFESNFKYIKKKELLVLAKK